MRELSPAEVQFFASVRPQTHRYATRNEYFRAVEAWKQRKVRARQDSIQVGVDFASTVEPDLPSVLRRQDALDELRTQEALLLMQNQTRDLVRDIQAAQARALIGGARNIGEEISQHVTATEVLRRRDEESARALRINSAIAEESIRILRDRMIFGQFENSPLDRFYGPSLKVDVKPKTDPRVAAEKLLRIVLPEDLHVNLAATGECEVTGKDPGFKYKLKKLGKTICTKKDGSTYSCCIEFAGTHDKPDTDRIVAEYVLITNDEKKYLDTANLTQVGGWDQLAAGGHHPVVGRTGLPILAGTFDLDMGGRHGIFGRNGMAIAPPPARIGDTVYMRRPPAFQPMTPPDPRDLREGDRLPPLVDPSFGREWDDASRRRPAAYVRSEDGNYRPAMPPTPAGLLRDFFERVFTGRLGAFEFPERSIQEFQSIGVILPHGVTTQGNSFDRAVETLRIRLEDLGNHLIGFARPDLSGDALSTISRHGKHMQIIRVFDPVNYRNVFRFEVLCVVER